jgi:hypothetical protein
MGFGREYVIGWGTLALINAGLAQGKGRSGLNWFLVSLALGPLATLAIVAVDKMATGEAPRMNREPLAPSMQVVVGALLLLAVVLASFGLRH